MPDDEGTAAGGGAATAFVGGTAAGGGTAKAVGGDTAARGGAATNGPAAGSGAIRVSDHVAEGDCGRDPQAGGAKRASGSADFSVKRTRFTLKGTPISKASTRSVNDLHRETKQTNLPLRGGFRN